MRTASQANAAAHTCQAVPDQNAQTKCTDQKFFPQTQCLRQAEQCDPQENREAVMPKKTTCSSRSAIKPNHPQQARGRDPMPMPTRKAKLQSTDVIDRSHIPSRMTPL
ncbi:hypothetical protein ACULME_15785 [Xanthomonas arboricola pv. corylina]|uniref:hypothetical protein n=1 Tax=Xanthomonas arboricola TaxID=56448 RepID=UPI004040C317